MSRSRWKTKFLEHSILKINKIKNHVWSRCSTIPFFLLNQIVLVHTGKIFKKIFINRERIGFKFGEFAPTRAYLKLKKAPKKIIKKRK